MGFIQFFSLSFLLILSTYSTSYCHGSVIYPPSRTYTCFIQNPEQPSSQGCADAIAAVAAGTQQFYDWPAVLQPQAGGNHESLIPNGQLASGGNPVQFGGLDLVNTEWAKTDVTAGPLTVRWQNTAPHKTEYYRVYITTADWTTDMPLTWDKLELLADTGKRDAEEFTDIPVVLPARTGHHVIYSVWQRDLAFSQEAFYSASDVDFGNDGGDNGVNDSAGPKVTIEGDLYVPSASTGMTDGQVFGLGIQYDGKIVPVSGTGLSLVDNVNDLTINKYNFSIQETKEGIHYAREGIQLPHGKMIKELSGYLMNNESRKGNPNGSIFIRLLRQDKLRKGSTHEILMEVDSDKTAENRFKKSASEQRSISDEYIIDNNKYIYYLEVEFCDQCDFSEITVSTLRI